MSLIAEAVRICLVNALLGQTAAGPNVEGDPVDPVATAVGLSTPYIGVFVDTESTETEGRSMIEGERHQDITLHIILPTDLKLTIGGVAYDLQSRSSGAALAINIIYRQIEQILSAGTSVWANLWREFVTGYKEIDERAYVLTTGVNSGVRMPAREIMMRCATIFSPPIGEVPQGVWSDFIAALTADPDPENVALGALFQALITGTALVQWQSDQAEIGATADEMQGLGLVPFGTPPADPSATMTEVDIDGRTGTADALAVTADAP